MGWNIGVKTNTLRMKQIVADRLIEASEENGQPYLDYSDKHGIGFCYDAMEHMDFLWQTWALKILDDPSVNGDVVFMSAEGDNAGDVWGYRFKEGIPYTLTPKEIEFEERPIK